VLLYLGFLILTAAGGATLALANRPDGFEHGGSSHAGHLGGTPADATVIRLLTPSGGTTGSQLALVFETEVPLTGGPDGWGARGLHLHALVNGAEIMSGGARIERIGENRYRWDLPLQPGLYRVALVWASHQHGPIAQGASSEVQLTLASPAAAASAR
jgi:hypothetical protein